MATTTTLSELSDPELARRCQAGSLASFEALVYRHEQALYRFLCGCTRNETDARDLTQAAFVAAHRAIDRYRPSQPFAPWLYTIARRKFLDHCRKARPELPLETVAEPEVPDNPAESLSASDDRSSLWKQVKQLVSADQFQALWLHYHDDLPLRDIAQVLGRTETSVKVLLFRARRVLHRRLRTNTAITTSARTTRSTWTAARPSHPLAGRSS